jgi:hypothetical protein
MIRLSEAVESKSAGTTAMDAVGGVATKLVMNVIMGSTTVVRGIKQSMGENLVRECPVITSNSDSTKNHIRIEIGDQTIEENGNAGSQWKL